MGMDKEEKDRLAQLGLDRRLAEAVGALDLEASTFLRIAGDENAEEAEIMQAASNYRAAVQRRNLAYDRACGIPEDEAGKGGTYVAPATLGVDSEELRAMIDEAVAGKPPAEATIDEDALRAAIDKALEAKLAELNAAGGGKPAEGNGGKAPAAGGKAGEGS